MSLIKQLGMIGLLCMMAANASAQLETAGEIKQISRSAGKFTADNSIDLKAVVKTQPTNIAKRRVESRLTSGDIANRHDQYFSIYDADVELLSDIDRDGFHHLLNVIFDVDVDYDSATLYAKLYLSREGGPWIQYTSTELFNIHGNDTADTYEVTTELVEGYPPGYYSVMIEIYSLNHSYMVTSEILDHYYLGKDVMLEDYYRDEVVVYEEVEIVETHGAGSFSLLWLLLVQVVVAARGIFTLSPRKTIKRRKKIPLRCDPFKSSSPEN